MIQIGRLQIFPEHREIRFNGEALRIGSRAFDILDVLIRANGALVSKEALMNAVWPDTVVEENNIQVHIAALRKALGRDRDLIRTVPGRGYRLVDVRDGEPKASSRGPSTPGMPVYASSFVGRAASISEIIDALDKANAMTLVGAWGIGKTRLAIEVAAQMGARFPDGMVFVPLASVSDPRFILDALAGALGMAMSEGSLSLGDIASGLAGRRTLLVFDNCEHVLGDVSRILSAVSAANPALRVLATSRESLRLPGEALYRVRPLDVPDEEASDEQISQASAVQLFVERARAAAPRFALDEHGMRVAARICRRLGGIPLAIELAAARAAVLGVEVLAAHLDDHIPILAGRNRSG